MSFTFAVIADSHFHPNGKPAQAAWRSDQEFNDRNRRVVEILNVARPEFVVHLGDMVHPVPGLQAHEDALDVAQAVYSLLECPLHVVPGNHDIGDKPHPFSPAPLVTPERHERFEKRWGPPWKSFDHGGCHFVLINTPVINSGLPLEDQQWAWLEADLEANGHKRTFVFLHYPPFLCKPDEDEHYDNIAQPGRQRLISMISDAEATFCGHIHHFFWNTWGEENRDLYVLPSTAFVRPGYTELGRIAPSDEFGRNDIAKLGIFFVQVTQEGHSIQPVRTAETKPVTAIESLRPGNVAPACPLGVTLRHAWDAILDVPCDGLDPFRRKQARNDLTIQALWESGLCRLRLPIADLISPSRRSRLRALQRHGLEVLFFCTDVPTTQTWALLQQHADLVGGVEIIVPRHRIQTINDWSPDQMNFPIWICAVGRSTAADGKRFSHFTHPGFSLQEDPSLPGSVSGPVYWVGDEHSPHEAVKQIAAKGKGAALIGLPRATESTAFKDDAAVACRVAEALVAARMYPEIPVYLDGFSDHDRGYFPRHGLIDRRGNPRPALVALDHLNRMVSNHTLTRQPNGPCDRRFQWVLGELIIPIQRGQASAGIDLITGAQVDGLDNCWPIFVPA